MGAAGLRGQAAGASPNTLCSRGSRAPSCSRHRALAPHHVLNADSSCPAPAAGSGGAQTKGTARFALQLLPAATAARASQQAEGEKADGEAAAGEKADEEAAEGEEAATAVEVSGIAIAVIGARYHSL